MKSESMKLMRQLFLLCMLTIGVAFMGNNSSANAAVSGSNCFICNIEFEECLYPCGRDIQCVRACFRENKQCIDQCLDNSSES